MAHGARFINQGSLTLTNDSGLTFAGGTGTPTFENSGTFSKTNSTGVSTFTSINVTNTGTLQHRARRVHHQRRISSDGRPCESRHQLHR
jgi:hypothetical protein